ncbi:alpha-glucosidase family protein [Amphiplicatus metriothermophilus]|uniref:Alpha-glucosidase n=1 Tax=Amphiplicatus metriothermophilus TaxID=1519374 RepID=A0A239PVJ3_9PROT|nr:alpha-glucosidase family protein [Amphiplicatus metriothermophilus]MBB5519713.1 alpha-glucosidase [Amphiplicatus metriothermophilus]SNT74275.1 alpha-glucosidase [Amphiplicatus metriothermophilus]
MNLVERTPAQTRARGAAEEWWRGAVIYQIYPRSFCDSNGDGVGDLPGVIEKLDHVARLGVDGVWISPFFTSPMRDFGYDVADYCDVDPVFGTLADFDRLIEKAHGLGLKVIIDQVYSHTSDQHPWFEQSRSSRDHPKADWYVWADPKPDGAPPNNWQSVFGGPAWTWDSRRGQYYLHNFLPGQPDLNLHRSDVQDALLEVARFWLDRGVDGFRLDAINFAMHDPMLRDNPPAPRDGRRITRPFDLQEHVYNQSHPDIPKFLERIRALTDRYPGVFTVAEVGGPSPLEEMKAFTSDDRRLNSAYGFDFLYADRLTPGLVRRALAAWPGAPGEGWPSWAFSNHDAPRAASRWAGGGDLKRAARLYAMLLMALRGNVFLYQGDELGLPQAEVPFERLQDPEAIANWPQTLGRDGARTPIPWEAGPPYCGFSAHEPWLPVDPRHRPLAVDRQEANSSSTLHFIRKLIVLRRDSPALRRGDIVFLDAPQTVAAFLRRSEEETALCALNLGEAETTLALPDLAGFEIAAAVGLEKAAGAPPARLAPLSGFIALGRGG